MKESLLSLAVIVALSTTSLVAGDVRISGFINVVGGINDVDAKKSQGNPTLAGYNGDQLSSSYMGYNDKYDFGKDSLAAIQFSASIADNMGATIQIIAQRQDVNDDIRMEWGYVYFDVSDELRILAGRIRPSLFLYSDYLDVGYAYQWVTPPSEVYDQVNISNLDGVSAAYNLELGDNTLTTTIYAGNSRDEKLNTSPTATSATPNLKLTFDNIIGAEIAISNDYAKLRVGYIQAKVSESSTLAAAPTELQMNENSAAFYGVGLSVDYEDLLFASEYIVKDMQETGSANINAYYAMVGYKIGDFTPSYTYAVADSTMNFSNSTVPAQAVSVNKARAWNLDDRKSHTLGVRYDINPRAALKLEWNGATVTHSEYVSGTTITEKDEDINTYRIALNVVF